MADMNEMFGSDSENEENEQVENEEEEQEEHEVEEQEEHEGEEQEEHEGEEEEEQEGEDNHNDQEEENEEQEQEVEEENDGEQEEEQEQEEQEQEEHEEEHEVEQEEGEEEAEQNSNDNQEEVNQEEEEDEDDEIISRKKVSKAADVFGDELADLSEDEKSTDSKQENEDENDEQPTRSSQIHFEQEEEEIEPEQVINIEMPRVKTDLGKELHFVKLPNFLSIEARPFDVDTYEDETQKVEALDEEGKTRVRLKVENSIRWRYVKNDEGNLVKESNARIVKWSDGSMSMYLGNEIFDVYKTVMQGDHNHLFVREGNNVLHGQTVFKTKLSFRPHSIDSMTHRKMTMSLVDRGSKTKKVKLTEMKKNPENNRLEMIKKEEEKLKAASRRQNQQRRMREKSHSKGLTTNYLEDKYHSEDENHGISLAAIKNKFKSKANDTRLNSSSDESDRERRLNKAKQHNDDYDDDDDDEDEDYDDEDEDVVKKKSTSKKKMKKVVSDDDDD